MTLFLINYIFSIFLCLYKIIFIFQFQCYHWSETSEAPCSQPVFGHSRHEIWDILKFLYCSFRTQYIWFTFVLWLGRDQFTHIFQVYFSGTGTITLQWHHNGHDGISNHQTPYCFLNHLFKVQIKENINAPRHWPLCAEFTENPWIPRTKGQ